MKQKEIKIRFHHDDKSYYREFWEIFSEEKQKQPSFIIRDTSGPGGSWRVASGEFFEPNFEVSDEVTLILCNHKWEEHLRVGNDKGRFPVGFPTLEEACREAWNDFPDKPARCLSTADFWRWVSSRMPTGLEPWEQNNWRCNDYQTVMHELLFRFDFCGDPLIIIRTTEQHTKCRLTWRKYFAGTDSEDPYKNCTRFFGYEVGNYVVDVAPLEIANLPLREIGLTITTKDLKAFNAMIGKSDKTPYLSCDPKIQRLVGMLKEYTARQNKGLTPIINKNYICQTCGSRSGKCHPQTGCCFVCSTDNWKPTK